MVLPKRKKVNPILTIESQDWNLSCSNLATSQKVDTLKISRSSSGMIFLELLLLGEIKESLVFIGLEISSMEFVGEIVQHIAGHPNEKISNREMIEMIEALYESLDEIHNSNHEIKFEYEYNGTPLLKGISISFLGENSPIKLFVGAEVFMAVVKNWHKHTIEVINRNQRLINLGDINAKSLEKEKKIMSDTNELVEQAQRLVKKF